MNSPHAFKDRFSAQSQDYQKYRPTYPDELIQFILDNTKNKETAWDCATGNGQVAKRLVNYFARIYATDASEKQLKHAQPNEKIEYKVALAEDSGIPENSCDLLTVATALHWFDHDKFFKEAKRVLKPNATIAVWAYRWEKAENEKLNSVCEHFGREFLKDYWDIAPQKNIDGYQKFNFPFAEINAPKFKMSKQWHLEDLLGYYGTWSATQNYIQKHNTDPRDLVLEDFKSAWGKNLDEPNEITWHIELRIGKNN